MKKIVLALVVAVLPSSVAVAQQSTKSPTKPQSQRTLHPAKGNPCAMYGAGFVKMPSSNTCIKIGGGVSVEAGGSMRR